MTTHETTFRVFSRCPWQPARSGNWPGGLEPLATAPEQCPTIGEGLTREEAEELCDEWNDEHHPDRLAPPNLLPFYEYTSE